MTPTNVGNIGLERCSWIGLRRHVANVRKEIHKKNSPNKIPISHTYDGKKYTEVSFSAHFINLILLWIRSYAQNIERLWEKNVDVKAYQTIMAGQGETETCNTKKALDLD